MDRPNTEDFMRSSELFREFLSSSIFLISLMFFGLSGREGFSGLDLELTVTIETVFCCVIGTFGRKSSNTIGIICTCRSDDLSLLKQDQKFTRCECQDVIDCNC